MQANTIASAPYAHRAVALVLLWSELNDEIAPAEECASASELLERRNAFRRAITGRLQESDSARVLSAKQVQRYFYNQPPADGWIPLAWKTPLLDACLSGLSVGDASLDVDLAVRALFVDGAASFRLLQSRRPQLFGRIAVLLGAAGNAEHTIGASIRVQRTVDVRFSPTQIISRSPLPMAVVDAHVERILDVNHAFEQFYALSRSRMVGATVAELVSWAAQMAMPDTVDRYLRSQPEVIQTGRMRGSSELMGQVDFSRRSWAPGLATPPYSGVADVLVNMFEVLGADDQRSCFLVIYHVTAAGTGASPPDERARLDG